MSIPIIKLNVICSVVIFYWGAVVVMNAWLLDLQLPMQSVPITTNVVSLNPTQARCTRYNFM